MCTSLPARIVRVDPGGREADVEILGVPRRVSLAVLVLEGDPPGPGDWVLSSAGLAVRRITEAEAKELESLLTSAEGEAE